MDGLIKAFSCDEERGVFLVGPNNEELGVLLRGPFRDPKGEALTIPYETLTEALIDNTEPHAGAREGLGVVQLDEVAAAPLRKPQCGHPESLEQLEIIDEEHVKFHETFGSLGSLDPFGSNHGDLNAASVAAIQAVLFASEDDGSPSGSPTSRTIVPVVSHGSYPLPHLHSRAVDQHGEGLYATAAVSPPNKKRRRLEHTHGQAAAARVVDMLQERACGVPQGHVCMCPCHHAGVGACVCKCRQKCADSRPNSTHLFGPSGCRCHCHQYYMFRPLEGPPGKFAWACSCDV